MTTVSLSLSLSTKGRDRRVSRSNEPLDQHVQTSSDLRHPPPLARACFASTTILAAISLSTSDNSLIVTGPAIYILARLRRACASVHWSDCIARAVLITMCVRACDWCDCARGENARIGEFERDVEIQSGRNKTRLTFK